MNSVLVCPYAGANPEFCEGGSESVVDLEGGANPSIVSLKQGVWGNSPRSHGIFDFVQY